MSELKTFSVKFRVFFFFRNTSDKLGNKTVLEPKKKQSLILTFGTKLKNVSEFVYFFSSRLDSKTISSNVKKHVHRTKLALVSHVPGIGIGHGP